MERVAEIAVFLLVAWPVARLIVAPAFQRRLAAHPGLLLVVAGAATAYLASIALLAIGPPWLLRAATAILLAGAAMASWHARPSYGHSRGLPPGSLASTQLGLVRDERFLLQQAQQHGPVFKIARYGRPVACVLGMARGGELLRRADADLVSGPLPFDALIPGGFLRYMAPDDHARYRALVAQALPNELVRAAARPLAAGATGRVFAAMANACCPAPELGVAPAPHLRRLTRELLIGLVFGLGPDERRMSRLLELYPLIEPATLARARMPRAREAMAEIMTIVAARAAEVLVRASPASEPRCALDQLARDAPAALADATLLGNLVFVVENGGGDLAGLLGWALKMLGDYPQWAQSLTMAARDGAASGEPGLAERIVAETLRLEQSEYIIRVARRPVTVAGYRIPARWLVRICVRESHRDAAHFPDPERFDPDRFLAPRHDPRAYAPLGLGRHACLGRILVQVAGTTILETLARDFTWHVTRDGPREFAAFHWTPSSRFRIAVAHRDGGDYATV